MTDEKLEALIRLAKEAYQGTWHSTGVAVMAEGEGGMECVANMGDCLGLWQANSLYIEAARPSNILSLIERLNTAKADAKRYRWLKCKSDLSLEGIKFYEWDDFIDGAIQAKEGD